MVDLLTSPFLNGTVVDWSIRSMNPLFARDDSI
jgi:hypothetical protein